MVLGDGWIMAQECHKLVAIITDRPIMAEEGELIDWALCQQWSESCVHMLKQVVPRWWSIVDLEVAVPQLCVIQDIEGSILDLPVFRCHAHVEVSFAMFQPWQRVPCSIELGKLDFV
jgi:hypothetical protein